MNAFTIKDIENLSGIKAHTIRVWEQRYSFLKPNRTDTNIRYYTNEDLKTILNIALLNKAGYKISQINEMSDAEMLEKILSLNQNDEVQERMVNELVGYMIDFDTVSFEKAIDQELKSFESIDRFINAVVFPFLEKVGILWTTNHINPAQEHVVTNIIRQKLIVGIDKCKPSLVSNKMAVLFLPEGEHHELGLLYVNYLMKSLGIEVLYLGANVPVADLKYVIESKKPDVVYSHLTSISLNFDITKFLNLLAASLGNVPCYLSGPFTVDYAFPVPHPIKFKTSLHDVKRFVSSLIEVS